MNRFAVSESSFAVRTLQIWVRAVVVVNCIVCTGYLDLLDLHCVHYRLYSKFLAEYNMP